MKTQHHTLVQDGPGVGDVPSTIAGLRAQDCPGGGWNGQPADIDRATVADCLAHGVCGCIYGDAVRHLETLRDLMVREFPR